jgi:uncharacterized membrane protein YphA (DoxX/SURF4 family)
MDTAVAMPRWLLALVRIFLGCTFLFSDHGNASHGELLGFLAEAAKSGFPWYRPIVRALIIPHVQIFGTLVLTAEVTIGILLILGLGTRVSSIVAIVLLANYESAKGSPPWQPGIDQSDIVLALIIFVCAAGRAYGLDGIVHRRFSKAMVC